MVFVVFLFFLVFFFLGIVVVVLVVVLVAVAARFRGIAQVSAATDGVDPVLISATQTSFMIKFYYDVCLV